MNGLKEVPEYSPPAPVPDFIPSGSESLLWVDKYRPKSIKNIIGQQGDKSNAKKLLRLSGFIFCNIHGVG